MKIIMPKLPRPFVVCAAALLLAAPLVAVSLPARAAAQETAPPAAANPAQQKTGDFTVDLRVPPGGVYAGEESEIAFHVSAKTPDDADAGVLGAKIKATITGGTAAASSSASVRNGDLPGDYILTTTFPTGGAYRVALDITPPGPGAYPAVAVGFDVTVKDADPKRKPAPSPYVLEVRTEPRAPVVSQSVVMTLRVTDRATGTLVKEWNPNRENPIRLLIVRKDLGAFTYGLPDAQPDGTFKQSFSFTGGGEWRIFADFAPKGAGVQTAVAKLNVSGVRDLPTPINPQSLPLVRASGATLAMKQPNRLFARQTQSLEFNLSDEQGQPLTDLSLWLGALAQLTFIERDAETLLRAVPDTADPRNGRSGVMTFLVRFPKPGIYKGWMQFKRNGQIATLPFVVRVSDK